MMKRETHPAVTLVLVTLSLVLSTPHWARAQTEGEHVTTSASGMLLPADADVAVGLFDLVVIDNTRIHVYTKSGFNPQSAPSWAASWEINGANGFFESVLPPSAPQVFDPRVVYDVYAHRYWIVAADVTTLQGGSTELFFDIAVSATSDPEGAWHVYRFDARQWPGVQIYSGGNLDFPNIAIDGEWLYISAWCNADASFTNNVESPVWIIRKQELMDNTSPVVTRFQRFQDAANPRPKYNHRATPSPVLDVEASGAPQYFLGVDPGNPGQPTIYYPNGNEQDQPQLFAVEYDEITLHAITWPNDTAPLRHDFHIELPEAYRIPRNDTLVQPLFTPKTVRTNSARFWATPVLRDGVIWAAHHVRRTDSNKHEVRWYRITTNGWPITPGAEPEIAVIADDFGVIPAASINGETLYPSIGVNFWGDFLVGYHEIGPNQAPQPRYYFRSWDGAVEENLAIPVDCSGCLLGSYDLASNGTIRWGDYSGTEADPTDWCAWWTYHMWVQSGSSLSWRTWLTRVRPADLCALDSMVDFTRDGEVNFRDLQRFDEIYRDGKRAADFNRDRRVNIHDFAAYLDAYSRVP